MSKKTISIIIQLIVFLGLAAGLVIWRYNAISDADKQNMFEAFRTIRWIWLLPMFIAGFGAHLFRAKRWNLLIEPLGHQPKTANSFFAVMIGYLTNSLLPRVGEVIKCTVLSKYEKIPFEKLVGTIVVERGFDLITLITLLLLTLVSQFGVIAPFTEELSKKILYNEDGQFHWVRLMLTILVIIIGLYLIVKLSKKIRNEKIKKFITGLFDGIKSIWALDKKGRFLIYTGLIWLGYICMTITGFKAMPGLDGLTLMASLAVLTLGSVGMIATPGGIGAFPVIVAEVLVLYGVNSGVGFAFGWVSWAGQTAVVLLLGLLSLILLPIYNRNKQTIK